MKSLIHRLQQHIPVSDAEIDEFLQIHAFPWVEENTVLFFYRGDAEQVRLRHWIFGLPSSQDFFRIPSTRHWVLQADIPHQSRIEYKFEVVQRGHSHWIRDPLNKHLAYDPFGANSVCQGAGYLTPEWTLEDTESRAGTLEDIEIDSQAYGGKRHLTVYLPARFRPRRRYPLLIVHDGPDYKRYSSLKFVLDNLIHRNEVAPLIVALQHPVQRLQEYPDHPAQAQFTVHEVLPLLQERYPIHDLPQMRGLMGASFGGVATLSTAWRHPEVFGRLLLQSGSFAFTDIGENKRGPLFDPVVDFMNRFRKNPGKFSEKVFVTCGMYESLIYENRSIVPLLQKTGMEVEYRESRDGHNWINWRDHLRDALTWLFPGPLWMIYE